MVEEALQLIEDCKNRYQKLSVWDSEFIEALSEQISMTNGLSQKQMQVLEKIWEKVTSL